MKELLTALLTWIVLQTGLAMPPPPPVVVLPREQIKELAYGHSNDVGALYYRDTATIYLRDDWNPADLRSRATLLHELVHHVQAFNRIAYECAARREPQAYDLTVKWLREQGVADPYAVLNIDEFTIKIISTCPDR